MKANSDNTKDKKFINHPERLSILYHITRQLNSSLDLDKCLQKIIKQVSKFLNVSRASLMLLDEQDSELTIKCAIGIDRDIMKNTRIKIGQSNSVSSRVAQNGKPLLITDIQKEKGLIKWNSDKYFNNSLLSVPLKRRKKVLGVLNVNNKRDKKVFSKDDLNFLVMLANEFSLAIDNSRLYQRLIQVNKDLKKLHRAKSDFMEDISHNLRSPLLAVQYSVNIIKEKQVGRINAQQQRFLSLADNNLDYIFRSIDRLLEFSHLHSDKAALKKQQVYIAGFIKETVNSFYPLAKDKGVVLKSKGLNKDIKVFIDPDKIRDVLTNLIDNAIRFTPPRGKILVVMAEKHNFIEVSVIDTGAGIPAGVLKKLFTRFYPGNPPKSAQKRSFGLGLAISKSIIEIHGGNIGVASRKGKGSNFTFTLPRN